MYHNDKLKTGSTTRRPLPPTSNKKIISEINLTFLLYKIIYSWTTISSGYSAPSIFQIQIKQISKIRIRSSKYPRFPLTSKISHFLELLEKKKTIRILISIKISFDGCNYFSSIFLLKSKKQGI